MRKIIRFYNKNVRKIWTIIIVVAFLFLIRNILNEAYKNKNEELNEKGKNIIIKEENYEKQSESLVSGKKVSEKYQDKFGNLIDSFLKYCINHEPEKAYGLLSNNCKTLLYPTEEIFEKKYYMNKFKGDKKYTFQSWTSNEQYIYLIKVYENMITTGLSNEKSFITDYITVVKQGEDYKININGFVNKKARNLEVIVCDDISMRVKNSFIFMDYEIVEFEIANNTDNDLILDTKEKMDSIYLVDDTNIKFSALVYENEENDFIIESNKNKKINLKFNNPYRDTKEVKKFVFDNIRIKGENKKIEINL